MRILDKLPLIWDVGFEAILLWDRMTTRASGTCHCQLLAGRANACDGGQLCLTRTLCYFFSLWIKSIHWQIPRTLGNIYIHPETWGGTNQVLDIYQKNPFLGLCHYGLKMSIHPNTKTLSSLPIAGPEHWSFKGMDTGYFSPFLWCLPFSN